MYVISAVPTRHLGQHPQDVLLDPADFPLDHLEPTILIAGGRPRTDDCR
ncbi:MAG: hypothetical protein JSR67_10890 [Proteobacteria bacterium]|nr:hypothetical protein [Pseudomonadota bacterium]